MRKLVSALAIVLISQAPHGPASAEAAKPERVTVTMSSFKFSPNHLTLRHGRTYLLHLVNASGGGHDFAAPEFFAASTIAPADRGTVAGGKIKLAGKASADVTLTPQKVGVYKLHCSHFLHAGMGMTGLITVE